MSLLNDESEKTRKRRWRRNASVVIAAMMGIVFAYGLIRFPDAPLHACGANSYCGKQGQPHTERQFKDFEIWQNTLVWVWPIGMLVLYVLNRDRIRSRGWKPRE
jgi:hypothetical protein